MSISIRSRVVLLALAVMLPGVLGIALLIRDTYSAEREAHQRALRETAKAMSLVVDAELSKRATIAKVLSDSSYLDKPALTNSSRLAAFEQTARRAIVGLGGWVELHGDGRVLLDTRNDAGKSLNTTAPPLVDRALVRPLRAPSLESRSASPYASIVQPVERDGRVLYNLVITMLPDEMQRIIDQQTLATGWVGTVLDSEAVVVARHPGGTAHVGHAATADLRQLMAERSEGLVIAPSLDGRDTAGYFRRGAAGWTYVSGMPSEEFAGRLPGAVKRIAAAALALVALALIGVLWLAKRIVDPVTALKAAAQQLQRGEPVTVRATGLRECDDVGAALVDAATAIKRHRDVLEQQVTAAVERTRLAEQNAAQGQRVAAVGRLTGGVAHEFNNLLGVISNSAHLIQRHPAAAALQAPLSATHRAVESGSQLTQHLLRFAGLRPLRPRSVSLSEALPDVQELLRSVLGRRYRVSLKVSHGIKAAHVDSGELELALVNLALNARDAMPNGGELRLTARNACDDETATLPVRPGIGYVLITVGDDGVGIEPEVAAQVFEPFFTTKSPGQGSGLGLSQVHGFCAQAGGSVKLESTPGLGTTVVMLLPTHDATHAEAPRSAPPADDPRASVSGATVLLVEDNESLGDVTAALLMAHGARVQRAADAGDALDLIEAGGVFDVVLSDVMMPGTMDGIELARRLRHLRPKLPVVLITGFSQTASGAETEFTVLRKPCPQAELLAALHRAMALS